MGKVLKKKIVSASITPSSKPYSAGIKFIKFSGMLWRIHC